MEENPPQPGYEGEGVSDEALMERAKRQDQEAISQLYVRYHWRILSFVYRMTGSKHMAEEVAQETFIRLVQNLHRYRPMGTFKGWLYRIAANLAKNALRDNPMRRTLSLDETLETAEGGSVSRAETIPSDQPHPDEETALSEHQSEVQKALSRVPEKYRQVVVLCDIEGYSYKEVSEILHCPMNTVASRLSRGREQLAHILGFLNKEIL